MKILLLGDASNYHRTLSKGLAAAGHDVTVASAGSGWMETARDIDLSRRQGKLGGALLWVRLNTVLSGLLKGYDVVQIHNPVFVNLRPPRVRVLFDRLKRDNGAVFLTQLGTDSQYVDMCFAKDCPLRYSEFMVGREPTPYTQRHPMVVADWLGDELRDHCRYVYDNIDGVVSALYEYHLSCLRVLPPDLVAYGGIPVDMSVANAMKIPCDGKLRVMVAAHKGREDEKGIDRILPVVERLAGDFPDSLELDLVQNVPFAQFRQILDSAHVVVDQLYSYTPATTALMAMASGKVVVSGAEEEYYDFIEESDLRPIVNADPLDIDSLYFHLSTIVKDRAMAQRLSDEGRRFVAKHNGVDVVAQRFLKFWERRMR